jgi:hypothetical protein
LKNLSLVSWISNDLIAVGFYIDPNTEPVNFIILSTNGRIVCKFSMRKGFKWIKNSTGPKFLTPCIAGILDT